MLTVLARAPSRLLITGAIVAAHVAIITLGLRALLPTRTARADVRGEFFTTAQIIVQSQMWDKVPVPEVTLDSPVIEDSSLKLVQFDDSVEDELAGVIAPASAPRLSQFQTVGVSEYARRAHILPGHPVTVVLVVSVREDGRAGSVDVSRSSGNSVIDAAAVDYALELHWIPGTRDHTPEVMRVTLPVTLSLSS